MLKILKQNIDLIKYYCYTDCSRRSNAINAAQAAIDAAQTRIDEATAKIESITKTKEETQSAKEIADGMIGATSVANDSVASVGTFGGGATLDSAGILGACEECYKNLSSTLGNILDECQADLDTWNAELDSANTALSDAQSAMMSATAMSCDTYCYPDEV